jgi:hypothetical protein
MTRRSLLASVAPAALAGVAILAVACGGGGSAASGDDAGSECMPIDPPATCPTPPPSYKNEISFVIANDCASAKCHAEGGAEHVHDFTTYAGVYGDHITIGMQVGLCPSLSSGMPPPGYPQPTAAQRLDLVTWAVPCRAPNN